MFELNRIPYFVAVAETGSFMRAAELLKVTKSAVTTQIQKLERELAVQLFLRTTRHVQLTSGGSAFLEHCRSILERCETAQSELLGEQKDISGIIRMTATSDAGPLVLAPILAEFALLHPKIEVELIISDDVLDLVSARIDFAIREGELKPSGMKAIRLRDFEQWIVCGSKYKAALDTRNSIDSLKSLRWATVSNVQSNQTWELTGNSGQRKKFQVSSLFRSNNTFSVLKWVETCPGCAILPDYLVRSQIESGNITRLLPGMKLPGYKVHAVYPASTYLPNRTRILLDFIKLRLGKQRID